MNCWKSYDIAKNLGSVRLMILSLLGTASFFILYNLAFTDIFGPLKISHFNTAIYISCLLLIYPLHKVLHCLPIWIAGKKAKLKFELNAMSPKLYCEIGGAIPKRLYIIVILFPLLFTTLGSCFLTVYFPIGIYYYSIIGSINFGLSISDLLYFSYLFSAPSHAIIEDDRNGYRILIKQQYLYIKKG